VVLELVLGQQGAARLAVAALALADDDQHAVAAAAVDRLDDEIVAAVEQLGQRDHFVLDAQHAIELRHADAGLLRQRLGAHLVVHQRVQAARVDLRDEVAVALVHAEHAGAAQRPGALPGKGDHRASARKRVSSVSR
jgi:hypothetical protein